MHCVCLYSADISPRGEYLPRGQNLTLVCTLRTPAVHDPALLTFRRDDNMAEDLPPEFHELGPADSPTMQFHLIEPQESHFYYCYYNGTAASVLQARIDVGGEYYKWH